MYHRETSQRCREVSLIHPNRLLAMQKVNTVHCRHAAGLKSKDYMAVLFV